MQQEPKKEEFLCRAEAKKFNLWADGNTGDEMEAKIVDGEYSMCQIQREGQDGEYNRERGVVKFRGTGEICKVE